jgi:hypothetical protein
VAHYGYVPVAAMPIESPGMVATAARQINATSKGGGHPCPKSCDMTVAFPCSYRIVCCIL